MKRILFILFVILLPLTVSAAFIDFNRVTTYTDTTPIPAAKIPTIQYRGYTGPSSTGPWTAGNAVVDNLAISAPDPAPGATLWYTVDATLDGMTSTKAVAMSKSLPFQTPVGPTLRGVR